MIYVDASIHNFGRMVMCHMMGDGLDELHAMADRIGVARKWFQNDGIFPHYDIAKSKRALAVAAGAMECDRHQMFRVLQYWRDYRHGPPRPQFIRQTEPQPLTDLFQL